MRSATSVYICIHIPAHFSVASWLGAWMKKQTGRLPCFKNRSLRSSVAGCCWHDAAASQSASDDHWKDIRYRSDRYVPQEVKSGERRNMVR